MPKGNEVDEKVMPVAWVVTNGGESCEPWLEYEQSEVDALPAVCIAEPLYSAATVAELRAEVERLRDALDSCREGSNKHVQRRCQMDDEIERINAEKTAAERRVGELEANDRRYRFLRQKVCIISAEHLSYTKAVFEFVNLPYPTYVAQSAAYELDAAIDALTGADPT